MRYCNGHARMHAACQKLFLGHRCIVIEPDGHGAYRLWQVVATVPVSREKIEFAVSVGITSMISSLVDATELLQRAHRDWVGEASELPISLSTLSEANGLPRFVGLMPFIQHDQMLDSDAVRTSIDWSTVITEDLRPAIEDIRRLRDTATHYDINGSLVPRSLRTNPAGEVVDKFIRAV